jgi:hypothetical protein
MNRARSSAGARNTGKITGAALYAALLLLLVIQEGCGVTSPGCLADSSASWQAAAEPAVSLESERGK